MMKVAVIIPARLHSSRLPRKVLSDICGKTMLEHVYMAAKKADQIDEIYIATDSKEVLASCQTFTSHILMTKETHESGTDRLAEAIDSIDCDAVINVQGDEPLMDSNLINALALELRKNASQMISAMHKISSTEDLKSANSVKVTVDKNANALYFSRSIIPHHRDGWKALLQHHRTVPEPLRFFKHIGIYGYTKAFLKAYSLMPQSYLEKLEKLEQLRVLENGFDIKMIETTYEPVGVDTQEDLARVRKIMCHDAK